MTISTCVILNPRAGRGRAAKQLEAVRKAVTPDAVVYTTKHQGHAIELARQVVADGFQRVIAAGGDGTVHEVANGLLQTDNRDVILAAWPLGSSNDYARTLGMGRWWKQWPNGGELATRRVDVGVIRAGDRCRHFMNGAGIGFNGMVTIEAHRITWLRGVPLYTLAFLRAMRYHFAKPMMQIVQDGIRLECATLAYSLNLGQREGGFPVTWEALIDDGRFEVLHAANLQRWELVRYLPGLLTGNLPKNHPEFHRSQCATASVHSCQPLCIHTDGELICIPQDSIVEASIEILPQRLTVEVCPTHLYDP